MREKKGKKRHTRAREKKISIASDHLPPHAYNALTLVASLFRVHGGPAKPHGMIIFPGDRTARLAEIPSVETRNVTYRVFDDPWSTSSSRRNTPLTHIFTIGVARIFGSDHA